MKSIWKNLINEKFDHQKGIKNNIKNNLNYQRKYKKSNQW